MISHQQRTSVMRALSPSRLPPVSCDDGSTASTATRWPAAHRRRPSASMKVDLPAPGGPDMPMRKEVTAAEEAAGSTEAEAEEWAGDVRTTR